MFSVEVNSEAVRATRTSNANIYDLKVNLSIHTNRTRVNIQNKPPLSPYVTFERINKKELKLVPGNLSVKAKREDLESLNVRLEQVT